MAGGSNSYLADLVEAERTAHVSELHSWAFAVVAEGIASSVTAGPAMEAAEADNPPQHAASPAHGAVLATDSVVVPLGLCSRTDPFDSHLGPASSNRHEGTKWMGGWVDFEGVFVMRY